MSEKVNDRSARFHWQPDEIQWGTPTAAAKGLADHAPLFPLAQWRADLLKHCGVCDEDDQYFGMPVSRAIPLDFPHQGRNGSEVIAISPPHELDLPSVPALWKPESREDRSLSENIGGPQFMREEAAYLVDRAFTDDDHHLVPLAYVIDLDGDQGAVLYYSQGHAGAQEADEYGAEWIELAAIEDFINGQTDRAGHNWLTHPDDETRPLLIDNGLAFPTSESPRSIESAFIAAWGSQPITTENRQAVAMLCADQSLWHDLELVIGKDAATLARLRACAVRDAGAVPQPSTASTTEDSSHDTSGSTPNGSSGL